HGYRRWRGSHRGSRSGEIDRYDWASFLNTASWVFITRRKALAKSLCRDAVTFGFSCCSWNDSFRRNAFGEWVASDLCRLEVDIGHLSERRARRALLARCTFFMAHRCYLRREKISRAVCPEVA